MDVRTDREIVREKVEETPRVVTTPAGTTMVYTVAEQQRLGNLQRVRALIYFVCSVVCLVILARFGLLLAGADPANPFANTMYRIALPLMGPFKGLFGEPPAYFNGVFEYTDLIAIGVYMILAWIVVKLCKLMLAPADPTGRAYV